VPQLQVMIAAPSGVLDCNSLKRETIGGKYRSPNCILRGS
jgi:hypothetical protein